MEEKSEVDRVEAEDDGGGILSRGLVDWLDDDVQVKGRLQRLRDERYLSPAVREEGEMEKCICQNENAAEGLRTPAMRDSENRVFLSEREEWSEPTFETMVEASGAIFMTTFMDDTPEPLEEALGEISGSNSSAWTALLRLKKAALIDRLLDYKGLPLVTLGLQLWHRRASDNSLQGGIQTNPLVVDNVEVMRGKLQRWCQTDLAGFVYECEIAIDITSLDKWLYSVRYSLDINKADKFNNNTEEREKIISLVKKELDKGKAGGVLSLLVKD